MFFSRQLLEVAAKRDGTITITADGVTKTISVSQAAKVDVVSEEKITASASVSVYPNPTTDGIIISGIAGEAAAQLFNAKGEPTSAAFAVTEGQTISLGALTAGTYYVVIATGTGSQTITIIKK
jgi:hypothetical protein